MQPKPGRSPMSFHRGGRQIQYMRSFFDGKTTEESQLDNAALLPIEATAMQSM